MDFASRDIETPGIGSSENDRFVAATIEAARTLRSETNDEMPWLDLLIQAIEQRELPLPSLSPTFAKVIRLIELPEIDLDQLADVVGSDPALATRIIGVANSSYFRGLSSVPNVREALMRMGIREARTVVIVVALRSSILRSGASGPGVLRLWKHSLLAASATQDIAGGLPGWQSSGFLAGLVHDLGSIVLLGFTGSDWARGAGIEAPEEEAFERMLEVLHAPVGAMVLASWGFAEAFSTAVLYHSSPEEAPEAMSDPGQGGDARSLACAIELGHRIADQIAEGWPSDLAELPKELIVSAERLGLGPERLAEIAVDAEASFEALSAIG